MLALRCGRRQLSAAITATILRRSQIIAPLTSSCGVRRWASSDEGGSRAGPSKPPSNHSNTTKTMAETKEDLRKRLTPLQYQVTQEAGTERPFTGKYDKFYEEGQYQCIVCHQDLFSSKTKFDAGCGWPAFNDVLDKGRITLHRDASIAGCNLLLLIKHPERIRTEVRCAQCGAHMGHVFEDGPPPTRKRYCINSAAVEFLSADQLNTKQ